jgi:hypothetical protein
MRKWIIFAGFVAALAIVMWTIAATVPDVDTFKLEKWLIAETLAHPLRAVLIAFCVGYALG